MNFRGGPGRNALSGRSFESNSNSANNMSFEEAMEAARFADLGGIITADDYETSSVSYNRLKSPLRKPWVKISVRFRLIGS